MKQSHYRALLSLGLPIVIGQIGVIILGFADTIMVGHHSSTELAAASFVNNMCSERGTKKRPEKSCGTAFRQTPCLRSSYAASCTPST